MLLNSHTIQVQQLFLSHHHAIKAFVLSLLPDLTVAEDVVQETFLTVTENADDFELGSNFFAWSCTIARHRVARARRNHAHQMLSPEVVETLIDCVPDDAFDPRQMQALKSCLDRLPPRMQELVKLRYAVGRRPGEIAGIMARTLNSVNSGLAKARAALRECVKRELHREEPA